MILSTLFFPITNFQFFFQSLKSLHQLPDYVIVYRLLQHWNHRVGPLLIMSCPLHIAKLLEIIFQMRKCGVTTFQVKTIDSLLGCSLATVFKHYYRDQSTKHTNTHWTEIYCMLLNPIAWCHGVMFITMLSRATLVHFPHTPCLAGQGGEQDGLSL